MNIEEIVASHGTHTGYREYNESRRTGRWTGKKGTEIEVCDSEDHYHDQGLVPADECHVRILLGVVAVERARIEDLEAEVRKWKAIATQYNTQGTTFGRGTRP